MQSRYQASAEEAHHNQHHDPALTFLAVELREIRQENHRTRRQLFWMMLALMIALVIILAPIAQPLLEAHAQPVILYSSESSSAQAMDPLEKEKTRQALHANLPEQEQEELKAFEDQVSWLKQYMRTWDQEDAGAVVALMLYRMAENMQTMPSMEEQMRAMGDRMNALPVIANELTQINAKMSVITANMGVMTHNLDSTMGRAGRMMPWMPFSP